MFWTLTSLIQEISQLFDQYVHIVSPRVLKAMGDVSLCVLKVMRFLGKEDKGRLIEAKWCMLAPRTIWKCRRKLVPLSRELWAMDIEQCIYRLCICSGNFGVLFFEWLTDHQPELSAFCWKDRKTKAVSRNPGSQRQWPTSKPTRRLFKDSSQHTMFSVFCTRVLFF